MFLRKIFIFTIVIFIFNGCLYDKGTFMTQEEKDLLFKQRVQEYQLKFDKEEKESGVTDAIKNNIPLSIKSIGATIPNSVGGVNVFFEYLNLSKKDIKYLNVGVVPYNNVGDKVSSKTNYKSYKILSTVGPLKFNKNYTQKGLWKNIWYNQSIKCVKIEDVEIILMDNTKIVFKDNDLIKLFNKKFNYRKCGNNFYGEF
ncbi:hypothetical protein [Arcobacter peruensis]|uniref:hypothetical protein n=1 Tax=Arcobacter peruensis TaxID=2320140 RepID=UPI0013DF64CB|nr:hypothetical protein [Arcobacter peruensis]